MKGAAGGTPAGNGQNVRPHLESGNSGVPDDPGETVPATAPPTRPPDHLGCPGLGDLGHRPARVAPAPAPAAPAAQCSSVAGLPPFASYPATASARYIA